MKLINRVCPFCRNISTIETTEEKFQSWINENGFADSIFDDLTPEEIIILKVGICRKCQNGKEP